MIIKNTTAGPITVQGIMLVPGQDTEIPEAQRQDVARDLEGVPGVEVVKERAKAATKAKDD